MTVAFPPRVPSMYLCSRRSMERLDEPNPEQMAALLIRALAVNGDTWRPIGLEEVIAVIEADIAANHGPWARLKTNPFTLPASVNFFVQGTTDGRFAEWFDKEGGLLQFTPRRALPNSTRIDKPGTLIPDDPREIIRGWSRGRRDLRNQPGADLEAAHRGGG